MVLTPHIIIGALIAKLLPDTFWLIPLVILSHYSLDIIPHWDYINSIGEFKNSVLKTALKVILDLLSGLILVYIFLGISWWILLGIFMAILPDLPLLMSAFWKNKLLSAYFKFNHTLHYWRSPIYLGILSQMIVITIFVLISLRLKM